MQKQKMAYSGKEMKLNQHEILYKTLQKNDNYIQALHKFYLYLKGTETKNVTEEAIRELEKMHQNAVKASILSECLRLTYLHNLDLLEEDFNTFAIWITKEINNSFFYQRFIVDRIKK